MKAFALELAIAGLHLAGDVWCAFDDLEARWFWRFDLWVSALEDRLEVLQRDR